MEKITVNLSKKQAKLIDALATFQLALEDIKHVEKFAHNSGQNPERMHRSFRDSLIQRFEYSFDLFWKFINEYLEHMGHRPEMRAPKAVFREALKTKLFTESETRIAIQMVNDRNLTTHGYDEPLTEAISKNIPSYYKLMMDVLHKCPLTE